MLNHLFISYSTADAFEFAVKLADILEAGPPPYSVWLDKRRLHPGDDWDEQLVEALKTCACVIFIMTPDSVAPASVCKNEWSRALKYKKPIIPLKCHRTVENPFQLENRQYIDFTGNFETGLAKLRQHIDWLNSPAGQLQELKNRLGDARREHRRTHEPQEIARIQDDIKQLEQEIEGLKKIVDNPEAAQKGAEERIASGLERERQPKTPITAEVCTRFINPLPGLPPNYFQDRYFETTQITSFLKDDACRLLIVSGRAGVGKTAMVCRLLKALENGHLPDDLGDLKVDGMVYLSEAGSHKVNFANIFADLGKLLAPETAQHLDAVYKNPQLSTSQKMQSLLAAFPNGRILLLLDNFEDKIAAETMEIADSELKEALETLLDADHHAVKVLITTRVFPHPLLLVQPGRQRSLPLDTGLESPFAENVLREMDPDGKLGLKTAPDQLLNEARERTRGFPRALEALKAILAADRETTLPEILADTQHFLPEFVVEKLVGEAFSRLDAAAQMVMQALAIYARPVTTAAVDYLLQPYLPGVDSSGTLKRLVNMQFVRKETGRYYLHPVDRDYACSCLPEGSPADYEKENQPAPFTRHALWHRGADYFRQARLPRENWKNLEDLTPQLAEFELLYAGGDFDTAADILTDIAFDYLQVWGHYRFLLELHARLQGKIQNIYTKEDNLGNLGSAYYRIGQIKTAIQHYEQALEFARQSKNLRRESIWLGNLGLCYIDLGKTIQAIEYHKQGLQIDRKIKFQRGEATKLCNLGICYADLGQTTSAIEFYEQALAINRLIGHRLGEANDLGNLSTCYADLGQTTLAIKIYKQALAIHCEIGHRYGEVLALENLGVFYLDQDNFLKAIEYLNQSIQIGDEIGSVQAQSHARYDLAQAYLFMENLPKAQEIIEQAQKYDYPPNNFNVQVLAGIILLRLQRVAPAQAAFQLAQQQGEDVLQKSEHYYSALDAKGLALCGLALCEGAELYVSQAAAAFQAARKINQDVGIVNQVRRLFGELVKADTKGLLKSVAALFPPEDKSSG